MTLKTPSIRVDAKQGTILFFGALSACFFTLSGILVWELRQSDASNDVLRDQLVIQNEQLADLASGQSRAKQELAVREQALKVREDNLSEEEKRFAEAENDPILGHHPSTTGTPTPNTHAPAVVDSDQLNLLKKFLDVSRQLVKNEDASLALQGGRPLLRIPNAKLFSLGDPALTPAGKEVLGKLTAMLVGAPLDHMEVRITVYTDKGGEAQAKQKGDPWGLTASRALAIQHYLHAETDLPLNHILCIGLGDESSISSHEANNRRTEVLLEPTAPILPANALPAMTADTATSSNVGGAANNSLEPPPDSPSTTKP